MNQEEYVTENVFQELLENYPNLLVYCHRNNFAISK